MSVLDIQLEDARQALRASKKGLTVSGLGKKTGMPYHTAFKVVQMLRVAGEIEAAGFVPTGTHQAQAWRLK
jgi:hypothetical protein